jgi:hypothetical protein
MVFLQVLSLNYTKMCFKIRQFFRLNQSFSRAIYFIYFPVISHGLPASLLIHHKRQKSKLGSKLRETKRLHYFPNPFGRAFRTSESESADFSKARVRKFRTLKTLRTRTQRVCSSAASSKVFDVHIYLEQYLAVW